MRDQHDVHVRHRGEGLVDEARLRVDGVERRDARVHDLPAAHLEVVGDRAQLGGIARDEEDPVATRGPEARGRLADRGGRAEEDRGRHQLAPSRRQRLEERPGSTLARKRSRFGNAARKISALMHASFAG